MRIASFDIGKVNFAQYVEDFDPEELKVLAEEYDRLAPKLRRRVKGPMNDSIQNILNKVYLCGKRVNIGVFDLRDDKTSDKLDISVRRNLFNHLKGNSELWESCDRIIIEQQFFRTFGFRGRRGGGSEANVDAIKLGECVLSWFIINFPDKDIRYFASTNKTQILGAPEDMTKHQRKEKWAPELLKEVVTIRNDIELIDIFNLRSDIFNKRLNSEEKILGFLNKYNFESKDVSYLAERIVRERQKMDDVSDVVLQVQAYKYREFVARF